MGVIKRLIDFIKIHLIGEELSKFETDIVPTFKFGDIIFAERFCSEIEKEIIGTGHETGPYVVIGTDHDRIIGCKCTSTENYYGNIEIGEDYHLFNRSKKTYVKTNNDIKTIDETAFISRNSSSLNKFDQTRLLKALTLNQKCYYYDFGKYCRLDFDKKVSFEIGDVVLYKNNKYLILRQCKHKDRFETIPFDGYNEHHSNVDFSEISLNYKNIVVLDIKDLKYLNTINTVQFANILTNYQSYFVNEQITQQKISKNVIDIGALVIFNENLYYVTSVENNIAHGFYVKKGIYDSQYQVLLKGKEYQIFFDSPCDIAIDKDNYQVKKFVYDDERVFVREMKKDYFKNHKIKEEKPKKVNCGIVIGDFIYNPNDLTSIYLVVSINGKIITAISTKKMASGKIEYLSFERKGFKKYKSITSIEMNMIKNKLAECQENELKKVSKKLLENK